MLTVLFLTLFQIGTSISPIHLILLVFAFVFACMAGGWPAAAPDWPWRLKLIAFALAAYFLSLILGIWSH